MVSDAHADFSTHRQVSLLATESIDKMRKLGLDLGPGAFAENLTTEGIDLVSIPVGTQVKVGKEVVLEISQIGKECHAGCAIFRKVGKCVMPKEGVSVKSSKAALSLPATKSVLSKNLSVICRGRFVTCPPNLSDKTRVL